MLVKKKFLNALVKIISDNKYKTQVKGLLCNGTYPFIYDVKTTKLDKFPDPKVFYLKNFQIGTSVIIEMHL